jgi:hypothetical protein
MDLQMHLDIHIIELNVGILASQARTPAKERCLKHEETFSLQAFVFPGAKQSTE